ncbi:hypothetical protein J3R82DRAFT_11973 [Butyriboletus roseoflavus]|nr:hypothetical protein J3R82DRAFT_11973 [Butyriboletus roseoflavus]
MTTTQDTIDLTTSPPARHLLPAPSTSPSPRRRRVASPAHEDASDDPSDSERRRQKRRRPQSEAQQPQPSSDIFTQISTWDIPPDVVVDNKALPTDEEFPKVDQPIAASSSNSVPIDLSDSDSPTVVTSTSPIVSHDKPTSPSPVPPSGPTAIATSTVSAPEPLSAYTCPICFSPPTNATLTPCGHICCGQCLFTAVKSTIRRNMVVAMERAPAARCPVCRAEIPGWDGRGGGVIGLKMQVLYSL